jgi:hypothetical protein
MVVVILLYFYLLAINEYRNNTAATTPPDFTSCISNTVYLPPAKMIPRIITATIIPVFAVPLLLNSGTISVPAISISLAS